MCRVLCVYISEGEGGPATDSAAVCYADVGESKGRIQQGRHWQLWMDQQWGRGLYHYHCFLFLSWLVQQWSKAVFQIFTHNCRSIMHRFQFWHTVVRPVRNVDAHIFLVDKLTVSVLKAKFRKRNQARLFLIAVLIGSAVTSGSSIPMLIGWKFTPFPANFAVWLKACSRDQLVWRVWACQRFYQTGIGYADFYR